jgi:hypothetical protein
MNFLVNPQHVNVSNPGDYHVPAVKIKPDHFLYRKTCNTLLAFMPKTEKNKLLYTQYWYGLISLVNSQTQVETT